MRPRPCLAAAALLLAAGATVAGLRPGDGAVAQSVARTKAPARSARSPRAAARDSVLVRIGSEAITRSQVQRRLEELPEPYRANYGTPEGRQQFLDRLIEERVWLLGARKRGVAQRAEVRRQIEQAERDLLIRTYVNEVMAANPAPSDSEARGYYDAHLSDYRLPATVSLSHIQLGTEAEARRIKQWARGGQDWKKLAERYSADSLTRKNGGNLGTVTREGVFGALGPQPALAESAFALGVAGVGGPWRTDKGWHVVKVDAIKAESTRPFEQVRGVIVRQLGSQRNQDFYRQRLEQEKAALGFRADTVAIREFVSQKKTAQELFREGQEAGAPTARIAAYRRLVQEYPESDVSPQAQFMVGFIYSEELKNYDEAEKAFRQLLERYPRSELAESARWMVAHMRTEEAPPFMNLEADTSVRAATPGDAKHPSGKP